jgi:hypothetical protein
MKTKFQNLKNLLLGCSLCLLGFSSYGQVDTTVYGLARKGTPAQIYFGKINPSTGAVTNISDSSLAGNVAVTSTTIDPFRKIYYFITNGTFVGIDMRTGNVLSNPTISNVNGAYFGSFIFNCVDSTIYGLARKTSPTEVYLAKINPTTGVVTNISMASVGTSITLASMTIDPLNQIFYFINGSKFVGVDMITGNVVSNPTITNTNGSYFYGFLFNRSNATIYGLAQKSSPAEIYFSKIDPTTGVVTNISPASVATSITITSTTIDPFNRIYYFITDRRFVGIDMLTGNIVGSPLITNSNGDYFYGFRYNETLDITIPSVSTSEISARNAVLVYPNPFSSETTLRADADFKDATLTVYNSFGQQVKQIKNISAQTLVLSRDNLASGVYFIRLTNDKKEMLTQKIIVTD